MSPASRVLSLAAAAAPGAVALPTMPQELATLVRAEHERYGKLIRETNIKAN